MANAKTHQKRPEPGRWIATTTLAFYVVKRGVQLAVGVTQTSETKMDGWTVMAIESSKGNLQGVLDQHAHRLLGRFAFAEAVQRAQAYADHWEPGQSPDGDRDDMGPSKGKPRTQRRRVN
jgi:hypothetical protein